MEIYRKQLTNARCMHAITRMRYLDQIQDFSCYIEQPVHVYIHLQGQGDWGLEENFIYKA